MKTGTQIHTWLEKMALGQRTTESVLDKIVSCAAVPAKSMGVAAQARNLRFEHSGEILLTYGPCRCGSE